MISPTPEPEAKMTQEDELVKPDFTTADMLAERSKP